MSGMMRIGITAAYISISVTILSTLIPQKRTRRVMSFVIALFFIAGLLHGIASALPELRLQADETRELTIPRFSDKDYNDAVGRQTADMIVASLDELLQNEGIAADDINLTLKISDEGRISVSRVVIYINEKLAGRVADVESIIYRNVSKEPDIYVAGKKAQ